MEEKRASVQIIIPVYNEGHMTETVIAGIISEFKAVDFTYRILVLNDGSTDWTYSIRDKLCSYDNVAIMDFAMNRGKGAVLNDVFARLDSDYTVIIDADNEYLPSDIIRVLKPLFSGETDWVMGSRYGRERKRPPQYLATYLANWFLNWFFNSLSVLNLTDLLTGLLAFRSTIVKDIHLKEERFAYVPELIWAVHNSKKVVFKEIPVSYRFRTYAEGKKIQWWEFFTVTKAIIAYRNKGKH